MGELDATYGAVLVGVFVSAVLYGVTNVQVYVFFKEYPRDVIWNKFAVLWLWFLDTVHLALCFHMVYWYLITNYANPTQLLIVVWSFQAQIILDSIVVISVHTLYVIRVLKLNAIASTGSKLSRLAMPILVCFAILAGYAAALVLCWAITHYSYFSDFLETKNRWVTYYPLATVTGVDAVIATCLCCLLARCKTGFRKTDSTISWLMFYVLNTGCVTSLCSLLAITMMAVFPHNFAVISVEFSLTKVYINSFMAMFNARKSLRSPGGFSKDTSLQYPRHLTAIDTSDHTSSSSLSNKWPFSGKSRHDPRKHAIAVDISKDIVSEELVFEGHAELDNVKLDPLTNLSRLHPNYDGRKPETNRNDAHHSAPEIGSSNDNVVHL